MLQIAMSYVFSEHASTMEIDPDNAEPYLISGDKIEYPPSLLKKRIQGTITVEVDISAGGTVEKCTLKRSLHPLLDSIVRTAIFGSRFSPAFDRGSPVPSTLVFQIPISPDSMLSTSSYRNAELEGMVIDKDSRNPVQGAVVNLQYSDTISDTLLSDHFTDYMEIIGRIPGQTFKQGIMSVTTDSSGRFAFKLLPDGVVTIAVLAKSFSIKHFTESIETGKNKNVHYFIDPFAEEIDSGYQINVYGKDTSGREEIHLEKQQYSSGLTHYLSRILLTKATIQQVSQSGSSLLVRSGSPFDNCYLVAGIPMPAPFHFGGYPYADIDGIMLSALSNVNVTVNHIAGAFPNVSGALIEADPGIYRPAPSKLKRRPELSVDFSTISQDFLLSFPLRKQDFIQIGVTRCEDYSLKWLRAAYNIHPDAGIGIAPPETFGNVTLTGKMLVGKIQTEYFSWFSYDKYLSTFESEKSLYPWGMASIKMYPSQQKNFTITAGGGHQYFADGIRMGLNSFLKTTNLSNGILSVAYDSLKTAVVNANLSGDISYSKWNGNVKQRDRNGIDTFINEHGNNLIFDCRTKIFKQFGSMEVSSNALFAGTDYGDKPEFYIDAGASLLWKSTLLNAEFNIGKITSHPDFRGLPDSYYRKRQSVAYVISTLLEFKWKDCLMTGLQPYVRYQKNVPRMEPVLKIWNPSSATSLKAAGIDGEFEVKPFKWLDLNGAANFSTAHRGKSNDTIYEWNIPYALRGRATVKLYHNLLFFYLEGKSSKGLPYFNFAENRYKRLPDYRRFDFSVQYRSPIFKHRYFSRYDVYFRTSSILSRHSAGAYYWDEKMTETSIPLSGPTYTEIGVRLGFRL
jgi:TonB family protein